MAQKPDRTTWRLTKHNFRTGVTVEVHPKLIRGEDNAHRMIERLNRELSQEEKDDGISWFLQKSTKLY